MPTIKPDPDKQGPKDDDLREGNPLWGTHSDPGSSTTDEKDSED